MKSKRLTSLRFLLMSLLVSSAASAVVSAPTGYIYSTQLLGNTTQGCVAAGPGGTFVGVGPGFTANAQSVVLAKESGEQRLVVSGFNSINDCAYDATADVLYVTDNADNADFGIVSLFAAQSGDTVFAIPSASTASGLSAPGLEFLPADTFPSAAAAAIDSAGNVFVSDSIGGGGGGTVTKIVAGTPSVLVSGLDLASGITIDPATGDIFVAQTLSGTFDAQINRYDSAGTAVPPIPFAGPSFGFGTYDLAFDKDGQLLASGAFGGDVVSFDPVTGTPTPFVSGLTFASGVTVDSVTGRVELLSSTFTGVDEDKSLHRLTPVDALAPGKGSSKSECVHEFYGVDAPDGTTATCTDGDACDGDGTVNDRCMFPVGFCLNVDDPNFIDCADINTVASVEISARPFSLAISDAANRLAAALPLSGSTCVFSDGLVVPVKITGKGAKKDGKAKVKVKSETDIGQKDTDTIKLVCQPAPAP